MNKKYMEIERYVDKSKIKYDEPMSKYTTIKIGGPADVMVVPETIQDVVDTIEFAKQNNIQVTVVGNGSKLLVLDGGIRGIVIKFGSKFSNYTIDGEYITVNAGMTIPHLAIIAKDNSLSGLEFAAGIPGNVGGATYMNAGAYGSEMASVIEEVVFLDENLEVKKLSVDKLEYGYRTSIFKKHPENHYVILQVKYKLKHGEKEQIAELMKNNNDARKSKQPLEYPNAGSTFKRPEGYFVGKLIDEAGLRGYTLGGAQISTKHSGFIVNINKATAKDVLDLIAYIKKVIYEKNGLNLEEEIVILGEGE